ncbi:acyl-CoA thioesterase-1 [Salinibacter ruber]|nr:arylesterase [Salinibacter ruber]MBB4088439.1 acyl-CoA thioesterase-1 [Salinibacter ruber]MCS3662500.1 acyl-CoA thioesterase-1 [Salinibacter ruber]MCS3670864.1 acyl-CoA thioesterase-1 [Salinibacter ruber]MCS3684471.1 acyl-CoA thioesterase-1 [Salinibacter ruber]MCS3705172.1 acyl-CoA thioesterase-1 [Salinibacter ruber]
MSTIRLYLFLLVGVLGLVGCGQDRSTSAPAASSADTTQSPPASGAADTTDAEARVLVLGNSIAAGSGVSSREAFPARLQQKVDSLGWDVQVQNAGVSGETTAGGLQRIGWVLQRPVDVLVLELGGNDGLRGIDPGVTRKNLRGIIDTTLSTYPEARVLLTGMQVPPNLGPEYARQFRQVYPAVAEAYDRVTLIPFLLNDIAGSDSLMQDDGIHPTAAGHRLIANEIWTDLRPLLEERRPQDPA